MTALNLGFNHNINVLYVSILQYVLIFSNVKTGVYSCLLLPFISEKYKLFQKSDTQRYLDLVDLFLSC